MGNPMLNPGVPKCDEDLITLQIYLEQGITINFQVFIYMPQCENINIFGYLGDRGGGGDSKIRLGPYWFTSTLSFILIYMSNTEAI